MLKTGSPTYPVYTVPFMLRSGWEVSTTDERMEVQSRASSYYDEKSFPLAKHIGIYFTYMEGCILLLLAGTAVPIATRNWREGGSHSSNVRLLHTVNEALLATMVGGEIHNTGLPVHGASRSLSAAELQGRTNGHHCCNADSIRCSGLYCSGGRCYALHIPNDRCPRSVLQGEWDTSSGYNRLINTPTAEATANMWANSAFPHDGYLFHQRGKALLLRRHCNSGMAPPAWPAALP